MRDRKTFDSEGLWLLGFLRQPRRVYGCVLHLDIKDGKIWIEQNMTEMRVAQELIEQGVSKDDIVLGFHAPEMREYTGYGVV